MKSTIDIKLDEQTQARLKVLSELKNHSPHCLLKRAIQEYLEREETYEREKQEDMQRWRQYVDTRKYIGHDTVMKKLTNLAKDARKNAKTTE